MKATFPPLAGLTVFFVAAVMHAAAAESESLATRKTLTDGWFGLAEPLAARGVSFDLSTTGYYAGLLSGAGDKDFEWGGRADAFLKVDTGKLGLWDGGGFHVHAESRLGDSAHRNTPRSGGVWPPNTGVVLPLGRPDQLEATSIYYSHRFPTATALLVGKINAVDLLAGDPFFGGWARDRFSNLAFVAPPSGVVPPTIMGAVLSQKFDPFAVTVMVFDPEDRTSDYWVDELFNEGVNFSLGVTWSGEIAGRASSVNLTGTYSTKDGADLSSLLLPPDLKGGEKSGSFNVALGFSHLLIESSSRPGKGLGVYGKAAIADGNPNPIQASFVGGFAGHGIVPNRPADVFGIGYYYYNLSDDLQSSLAGALPIDDEQGVEIFYNLAATGWLRLTADLQWINPARGDFSDAWVVGLRASINF
jgi:porin